MAYKEDHNLFVGGKYGSFKGLQCSLEKILSKNLQNVKYINPESHITVMKWGDEDERELLLATANQTVKVYDTEYKSYVQSISVKYGQGPICGVSRYNGVLITAVESGEIRLWAPINSCEDVEIDPEDLDAQLHPADEAKFGADIIAGNNLSCMQHSQYTKHIIGSGGRGNDLKLWDLNTKQNVFSAKNLPDDAVRLTEPIWVSDIAFLPQENSVAVCSRYGYVRLYDSKAQRRPVWSIKLPDEALTCMALSSENNLICGLAKGDMLMADIRMKKLVHKYKGFLGAVRGIACHPTAPYIASVSLDRHVRIHHRDTKALLLKEYLKLPLHCVVMRSDSDFTTQGKADRKTKKRKNNEDDEELEEYNNMLNSLEKVEEKPKKIKKPQKSKPILFINPFANKKAAAQEDVSGEDLHLSNSDDSDGNDSKEEDDDDSNEEDDDDSNEEEDDSKDDEDQDDTDSGHGIGDEDDDSDCMIIE